jgi:hypothetical protein
MKKLLCMLVAVFVMAGTTFAQGTTGSKAAPAKTTQAAPAGKHMKKDGTPDKRYKENKGTKAAAGPTKKDGTPDMRYKANKGTAPKKDAAKKADSKPAPKK